MDIHEKFYSKLSVVYGSRSQENGKPLVLIVLKYNQRNRTSKDDKILIDEMRNTHVDSKKGLTCNEDVAVTSVDFCKQPFLSSVANPFEEQTPVKILTRQYKIGEFDIDPSWTGIFYGFPTVLLEIPAIAKAVQSFYYFHADIEVSVKLNSTPYHQGMMQMSFKHETTAGEVNSIPTASLGAYNPVIFNYSTSDTVDATYSWMSPLLYCNLPYTSVNNIIGTLVMRPIVPIANTMSTNTTIKCSVYARFVRPHLAGFVSTVVSQAAEGSGKFSAVTQEQADKSAESSPVSSAPAISLRPLFKAIPIIGDAYDSFASMAKSITSMLDKPRDIATPQRMIMEIAADMCQGTGLDPTNRLSLYPGSNLATQGIFPKECHNTTMLVGEIAGIPILHHTYDFTTENTQFEIGVTPDFMGNQNADSDSLIPDYVMWVQQSHRFWRGSMKYLVWFVTNSFTTCRVRISYAIDPAATDFGLGGDYPSRIIEIKGSTKVTIQVPFLYYTVFRATQDVGNTASNLTPKLVFSLLTLPVAAAGASPIVTAVVFRAGGEDMQFTGLMSSIISPPSSEVVQAQTSLQGEFKRKFDPIACDCNLTCESGYITSETTSRVIDCMRRYCLASPTSYGGTMYTYPIVGVEGGADGSWREPFYYYAELFRYFRGSTRFRAIQSTQTPGTYIQNGLTDLTGTGLDTGSGYLLTFPSQNPVAGLEIPWTATYPYRAKDTDSLAPPSVLNPVQPHFNGEFNQLYISPGDDFIMGYLSHLPTLTPVSSTTAKTNTRNGAKKPLKKTKVATNTNSSNTSS